MFKKKKLALKSLILSYDLHVLDMCNKLAFASIFCAIALDIRQ